MAESKIKLAAVEESCKRKLEEMDQLSGRLGLVKALVGQMEKDETWQWTPKIDDDCYGVKWMDPMGRKAINVVCEDGEYRVLRHGTTLKTDDPQKVLDFVRPCLEALNSLGRRNLARELERSDLKPTVRAFSFETLLPFADKFPGLRVYRKRWSDGKDTVFLIVLEEGKEFNLYCLEDEDDEYADARLSVNASAFLE